MESVVYSQGVIEFITISTEYCRYAENLNDTTQQDFVESMCPLLAMVYVKAIMLPDIEEISGYVDPCVTEDDYEYIRRNVSRIMGEYDDYLDVFVEEFKYSDQPVLRTVSEDLADIYQTLRNLVEQFRRGHEEAMQVSLFEAKEEFKLSWGQKLLNALKALHDFRFAKY